MVNQSLYRSPRPHYDSPIEWLASVIAIVCTTVRAFNMGYTSATYLLSCVAYIVFMISAGKKSQVWLNGFYIFMALVGAYQWW